MTRLAAKLADGKDGKAAALLAAAWETAANEPPARPPEPFLPAGFGAAAPRWSFSQTSPAVAFPPRRQKMCHLTGRHGNEPNRPLFRL